MLAGYLILKNSGDEPISVLATQSDRFRSVAVHQTVIGNGVSRIRELNRLEIASGKEITFAPGGLYLMLMQPRKEVSPGDRIQITFLLSDSQRVPAIFDVQAADLPDSREHAHQP